MYGFWYDHVKPTKNKIVLYGFRISIVQIKTDGIYQNIVEDVKTKFDTSNFEWDRQFPEEKNKNNNWIKERWIWWRNHVKFFLIKSKILVI